MIGFIAYGIALLLMLETQKLGLIAWFISIILVVKGTFELKEFWIDMMNTTKGLMFFMKSITKDTIDKFRRDRDANGK